MKRAVSLFLALVLASSPVFQASGQSRKRPKKSASQLKRDLAKVRTQKANIRKQLQQTKRAAKVVLEDIKRVDTRLGEVEDALEDTSYRLGESRIEQRRTANELDAATENLDRVREQVRARLKQIYMRGKASPISVFVGTRSAGDVASRAYLLQTIAKKDRQIFDEYTRLRELVASKKVRADQLVVEISSLADRQRNQREELKDVRDEKGQYLGELKERQEDLQEALAQFEADERQIQSQIAAFARRSSGTKLPPFIGRFRRPVPGGITSGFGMRFHPILKRTRLHAGVDFRAPTGTAIHAAASGEVIAAQYMRGYGNVVILAHGSGISTVYAHCSQLYVRAGQMVKSGETIAASGATGLATAPHLHWEVRVNGRAVNPLGRL